VTVLRLVQVGKGAVEEERMRPLGAARRGEAEELGHDPPRRKE
jgi:hypothetical protein